MCVCLYARTHMPDLLAEVIWHTHAWAHMHGSAGG
jgi:hypothetical protein